MSPIKVDRDQITLLKAKCSSDDRGSYQEKNETKTLPFFAPTRLEKLFGNSPMGTKVFLIFLTSMMIIFCDILSGFVQGTPPMMVLLFCGWVDLGHFWSGFLCCRW